MRSRFFAIATITPGEVAASLHAAARFIALFLSAIFTPSLLHIRQEGTANLVRPRAPGKVIEDFDASLARRIRRRCGGQSADHRLHFDPLSQLQAD